MASEISQMSDSSIVIIQGTVGLYTVATRCHTCFAVTLKYTEDSSLTILRHSTSTLFGFVAASNYPRMTIQLRIQEEQGPGPL